MMNSMTFRAYIPTQEDVQWPPLEIKQLETYLADIDTKFEILHGQLQPEKSRRNQLVNSVATKKSMCVPVRLVPSEILATIFENCVCDAGESGIESTNSPLVLTRVCWRWRAVAFKTPSIWTVINITPETIQTLNLPMVIPFWTTNSLHFPLEISICDTWNSPSNAVRERMSGEGFCSVMKILQKELYRCRKLTLSRVDPCSVALPHLLPRMISIPSLEELHIDEYSRPGSIVIDAPNLRTLDIRCGLHAVEVLNMFPSSFLLRSLEVNFNPVATFEFLLVISRFPELRHLSCFTESFEFLSGNCNATLQHLTSLNVRWEWCAVSAPLVLNRLQLPSLRDLTLRGDSITSGKRYEEFSLLTNVSYSQTLVSLTLEVFDLSGSNVVFERLTALEKLYFRGCCGTDHTLLSLSTQLEGGSWLCPRLNEIGIQCGDPGYLAQPLSSLISARGLDSHAVIPGKSNSVVYPLHLIDLSVSGETDGNLIEDIRAMGVSVSARIR